MLFRSTVAQAIARRPLVARLARRLALDGVRRNGGSFGFLFLYEKRFARDEEAAMAGLVPTQCPPKRWKGSDSRRCYAASDTRALVVGAEMGFDVIDAPAADEGFD